MSYPRQEPLTKEMAEGIMNILPRLESRVGLGVWIMVDTKITAYGLDRLRWSDIDCDRRVLKSVQVARNRVKCNVPIESPDLMGRIKAWMRYERGDCYVMTGTDHPHKNRVTSHKMIALGEAFGLDFCSYNLRHAQEMGR